MCDICLLEGKENLSVQAAGAVFVGEAGQLQPGKHSRTYHVQHHRLCYDADIAAISLRI